MTTRDPRPRPLTAVTTLAAALALTVAACGGGGAKAPDADVSGTWLGTLTVSGASLRVVFNLSGTPAAGFTGTVDVPEQGAIANPLSSVDVDGRQVTIGIADVGASFAGELSQDGQSIDGVFVQGQLFPLLLEKQPGPLDYRRPQDPVAPYPYRSQDVSFAGAGGITLAGTLTWPEGAGPFKAVVLIAGSGPLNRDEELLNHRPFAVLSDALTQAGVATLRYDKRGVGASGGDYATATSPDFAADARAAATWLRGQSHAAVSSIGLVGHSEGGMLAPMTADGNADIAFLVLLAAPGVVGADIIISQQRAIDAAGGTPAAVLDADEALARQLFACFPGMQADATALERCLRNALTATGITGAEQERVVATLVTPWMRFFATYDPIPLLRRTTIPVLALTGGLDLQVLADLNLPPIRAALAEAGNAAATVEERPGLNHLFQHATTGSPIEYGTITETMAPEVLRQVTTWIGAR
jgi:alpha/beta superfamily hydrolase